MGLYTGKVTANSAKVAVKIMLRVVSSQLLPEPQSGKGPRKEQALPIAPLLSDVTTTLASKDPWSIREIFMTCL